MKSTDNNTENKYDAFISYRHTDLDKKVAKHLHQMLESYKVPKDVQKMGRSKIQRVFRDRDELPTTNNLADSILEALKDSGFLIVICSPRTPKSQWVKAEIESFKKLHGQDRILALLIEGEPYESFPEEISYVEKESILEDGTTIIEKVEVEPLAADIRATSYRKMKKLLKSEVLRLIATIIGCEYDQLKQRHKERVRKRNFKLVFGLMSFFAIFGTIATYQMLTIKEQKNNIDRQNTVLEENNYEIILKNMTLKENNETIESQNNRLMTQMDEILRGESLYFSNISRMKLDNGDRQKAMLFALEGLPKEFDETSRPLVEESIFALSSALFPYKNSTQYRGDKVISIESNVQQVRTTSKGEFILVEGENSIISMFDGNTGNLLYEISNKYKYQEYGNDLIDFVNNDTVFVNVNDRGISGWNVEDGTEVWNYKGEFYHLQISKNKEMIFAAANKEVVILKGNGEFLSKFQFENVIEKIIISDDGTKIAIGFDNNSVSIIDTETSEMIQYEYMEYVLSQLKFSPTGEKIFIYSYDFGEEAMGTWVVLDTKIGNIVDSRKIESSKTVHNPNFFEGKETRLLYTAGEYCYIYDLSEHDFLQTITMGNLITDIVMCKNDAECFLAAEREGRITYIGLQDKDYFDFEIINGKVQIEEVVTAENLIITKEIASKDIQLWRNFDTPYMELVDIEDGKTVNNSFFVGSDFVVYTLYDENNVYMYSFENQMSQKLFTVDLEIIDMKYNKENQSIIILSKDNLLYSYDLLLNKITEVFENEEVFRVTLSMDGNYSYIKDFDKSVVRRTDTNEIIFENDNYSSQLYMFQDKFIISTEDIDSKLDTKTVIQIIDVNTGNILYNLESPLNQTYTYIPTISYSEEIFIQSNTGQVYCYDFGGEIKLVDVYETDVKKVEVDSRLDLIFFYVEYS